MYTKILVRVVAMHSYHRCKNDYISFDLVGLELNSTNMHLQCSHLSNQEYLLIDQLLIKYWHCPFFRQKGCVVSITANEFLLQLFSVINQPFYEIGLVWSLRRVLNLDLSGERSGDPIKVRNPESFWST